MRNSNTLKVLIFTRDISNNPEKLTIYARITVNGKRAEISLKRYVSVNEWDENKGRLHGLTHKARLLNSYLDEVYGEIMDTHKQLLREDKIITSQAIKARYLLARADCWLIPIGCGQSEFTKNGLTSGSDLPLVETVNFKNAKGTLNDL